MYLLTWTELSPVCPRKLWHRLQIHVIMASVKLVPVAQNLIKDMWCSFTTKKKKNRKEDKITVRNVKEENSKRVNTRKNLFYTCMMWVWCLFLFLKAGLNCHFFPAFTTGVWEGNESRSCGQAQPNPDQSCNRCRYSRLPLAHPFWWLGLYLWLLDRWW